MKNTKEVDDFLSNLSYTTQPNTICQSRTIYSLNWYSKKANFNKCLFYTLSIINTAAPLLSSIIITISPDLDSLVAILSAIAAFCASLLALFGAKDKWTNYRSAAEFLKTHYTLYLAKAAPYNTADRDTLYLNTIETQMQATHTHWINTQKTDPAPDTNQQP